MTTLLLVRHGETDWNAAHRIQGSTDIPLNDTGRAQAQETAATLAAQFAGVRPVVVASDLARARETAEIIAGALGVELQRTYPQLRERAYGIAEGLTITEYHERFGDWDRVIVEGAETPEHLRTRALGAARRVVRDARRLHAPQDVPVIAVSHGALIGQLLRHASGDTLPRPGERLANASTHTFLVERDRIGVLSYAAVPIG
ncbi:MAG: fructose-2,6-bisphosphatase [Microbacterium sp. SCN 70-200]|uniref:histidine phosphatase family protein n=1 Tax=unclassified Microbacterium TaxID=2609290 RepID=UPI00086BAEC9|nr:MULTISPECIES: histidine phosphatase family protein [unclassified Microbacterium]MBN9214350.1 histidine phosphatase family protein [Microbacterium sp.]ODT40988.1 MAG: fructose-2,6-bisphosphatase [Microbacterium sp. SCN 70-200]OJV83841.1 MAG: histidine phosphatase family protein [Microbacterium sp. 70-16]